jgi:tetratricopeptide (TPR) repeat protein
VFAALGLAMLWQNRARDLRGALLALTLGLGAGHGLLAEHSGFDQLEAHRPMHDRSLGIAWTALGRHDEALACFRRAARAGDGTASVAAADSLRRKGLREAARAELEEWIESHPEDAYAHKTLGITLAELGLLREARERLEQAWKLDRSDPETIAALQRVSEGLESKR